MANHELDLFIILALGFYQPFVAFLYKGAYLGNPLFYPYQDYIFWTWLIGRIPIFWLWTKVSPGPRSSKAAFWKAVGDPIDIGVVPFAAKILNFLADTGIIIWLPIIGRISIVPKMLPDVCDPEYGSTSWPCLRDGKGSVGDFIIGWTCHVVQSIVMIIWSMIWRYVWMEVEKLIAKNSHGRGREHLVPNLPPVEDRRGDINQTE